MDYERIHPETRAEWRGWLAEHHDSSPGVWLVQWRDPARRRMTYDDIVEEALCFGWIDSRAGRLDDERGVIAMTPRKARSAWARSNKVRVGRLIADGRMTEAGLRVVEAARANGTWDLLDDVEALVVPEDLAAALAENQAALRAFEEASASVKKSLLYWIKTARRPETRRRRISEVVSRAAAGRVTPGR